jgi:hypothetical protein
MKIKCDISGITPEQAVLCLAIESIYDQQSLTRTCELLSLNPLTFAMKTNLSKIQQQRLFADMVANVIDGYTGSIQDDKLVVSPNTDAKPVVTKRGRPRKGDSDLSAGELQEVA